MKLSQVLSQINQVERSKFVSCLDKIRSEAIKTDPTLEQRLTTEGQLKSASGSEITELFSVATKQRGTSFLDNDLLFTSSKNQSRQKIIPIKKKSALILVNELLI